MRRLDERLGIEASLFLQGCGGDAKTSVCGRGRDGFRQNHRPDVEEAGEMVAREVADRLDAGLAPVEPELRCVLRTTRWPLAPPLPQEGYQRIAQGDDAVRKLWAQRQCDLLDRRSRLPDSWPILVQGVQIGRDLRCVALEGEPVAAFGLAIAAHYPQGVTLPLGYSNGEGLYLVTSAMLAEGGMEPTSYWEYGLPAPLAAGTEAVLSRALADLYAAGIH
jgi:hypothetical protein